MNEPSQQTQRSIAEAVPTTANKEPLPEPSSMSESSNSSSKKAPVPPGDEDGDAANDPNVTGEGGPAPRRLSTGSVINLQLEGTVVPKMEPIPWYRFLYLSVLVAIPTVLFIALFTALGWGEVTFNYLSANFGDHSGIVGGATFVWFLILYLLDANTWTSRVLQVICGTVFVLGAMLTILNVASKYPFGPICVFAAVTPLWLLTAISVGRRGSTLTLRTKDYVRSLSGPLFFVSVLTVVIFVVWAFINEAHEYNQVTQVVFSQTTGCVPNLIDYPECSNGYIPPTPPPTLVSPHGTTRQRQRWLHNFNHLSDNDNDHHNQNDNNDHEKDVMTPTQLVLSSEILDLEVQNEDHKSPSKQAASQVFANQESQLSLRSQQPMQNSSTTTDAINSMYSSEATGVCFDTQISPPAFTLDQGCDINCPRNVYSGCTGALLLWAGPLLCSMVLFFLSFFCTFLQGDNVEKDIINFGKLWLFLLFTIWITVSLAGVGAGMSTVLAAMTLASFVGAIFFVTMTRPKNESKEQAWVLWSKFEEKCGGYLNVARAIFMVFCSPLLMVYFALSVVNQAVRRLGLPCSKPIKSDDERADIVTKRARLQIKDMRSWDRTKVLTYSVYVGLTYLILSVVISKFAYLIMTILVDALKDVNLGAVTAILIAFGLTFFLNPFLPGPPVYTMNGLVLFVTGEPTLGLYGALAYGIVLSLFIKLLACAMQQKMIGENLSKYVTIRKLVGINSGLIKATRLILSQPGIKIDKVCILVGGPDWPTSVLCGIMHLDLFPILLGTIPILVICAPTALLGAFLYMSDLKGEDGELTYPSAASFAALATALTAVVCLAIPIMAAYYLEQKMNQAADEIAAMPIDEEVAELEVAEETYNKCYEKVTAWTALPGVAKLTIYLAFVLIVLSVFIVLIVPKQCFTNYSLTSTVEDDLDGDWTNLVKPLGWVSIALFTISWGLVYVFTSWASYKAKDMVASEAEAAENASTEGGMEQPVPPAALP